MASHIRRRLFLFLSLLSLTLPTSVKSTTGTFTVGNKTSLLNGQPLTVKAAEIHYPRILRAYWERSIKLLPRVKQGAPGAIKDYYIYITL